MRVLVRNHPLEICGVLQFFFEIEIFIRQIFDDPYSVEDDQEKATDLKRNLPKERIGGTPEKIKSERMAGKVHDGKSSPQNR